MIMLENGISQVESTTVAAPPRSPIEPVTDYYHGSAIIDPYRWLEDQNSDRTRKWIAEQTSYTRAYLDAIPGRSRIRNRVEQLLAVQTYREPRKAGNRCFFLKREAYQEQPVLVMREGESGEDIVLLDPVQMTGSPQSAISVLATSPNGKLLAFAARAGGEDCAPIGFLDVDNRQVLGDRLPAGICGGLVLSEDRRGFYYVHRELNSPRPCYQAVFWHKLGTPFAEDEEIFFLDERPNLRLIIAATCGSCVFLYRAATLTDPMRSDFYLHDLSTGRPPEKILENIEGIFCPFFVDERLFAFTDHKAPNRRVIAIDLRNPVPANWQTVVPEDERSIEQFAVAGDSLYVVYLENLAHRILIFDLAENVRGELTMPAEGSVQLCWQPDPTDTLFYQFSSFAHPLTTYEYRRGLNARELSGTNNFSGHRSPIEVKRVRYPAKDGTLIPMFLVSKKDAGSNGPRPVFLTGYGGFGTSITPRFTAYATVLMELGCVFAVANVRGGAEFGKEWHEAAKRRKRQTAIDDFLSAAEWLLAKKIAEHGRIGIGGGSNAGLLVGAALTQRPGLFRAVLCLGPLLDMLRYHKFDLASDWIEELGSADQPDDFRALYSYSPYHRIRDNVAYPAVMFISGDADTRCNPMHTRKMAARLQAANVSNHPILLDYKPAWGHVPVQPLTARVEALTDRLLFLCRELDLKILEAW
jgi:prolyl oligopeptidase